MNSNQSVPAVLQVAPRKRRRLSGEKKNQVLQEIKQHPEKKSEILRREGLYQNDLKRFDEIARDASIKALGQMQPGKRRVFEVPAEQHGQRDGVAYIAFLRSSQLSSIHAKKSPNHYTRIGSSCHGART